MDQATVVLRWITDFDPQNINNGDLSLPIDLKQMSNYTKTLINDLSDQQKVRNQMKKKYNTLRNQPSKEQIFHINTDGSLVQTLDFSKNISEFMRGENISSIESSKSA